MPYQLKPLPTMMNFNLKLHALSYEFDRDLDHPLVSTRVSNIPLCDQCYYELGLYSVGFRILKSVHYYHDTDEIRCHCAIVGCHRTKDLMVREPYGY